MSSDQRLVDELGTIVLHLLTHNERRVDGSSLEKIWVIAHFS